MNKKGIGDSSREQLVFFIIIAVSLVVALIVFATLKKGAEDSFKDQGCWSSISTKTLTSIEYGVGAFENTMNTNCPLYELTFFDEKYLMMKGGEKFQDYKYTKINHEELINEDTVNDLIADELVSCWQKFGSGTLDAFFVPEGWIGKIFADKDSIGCRTCTIINFDTTDRAIFDNFKEYLESTKLVSKSKKDDSPGDYYYDYIAEKERFCDSDYTNGVNCWEDFAEEHRINTNINFNTEETYFIVFIRQGALKGKGTLNAYIMDYDARRRVCEKPLPFR